ncbi:hypothetical protein PoB_007132100 [Plakobranchus ocellatus]|uniref:Uncharacterized protein n=1 Tax=Plakobranchus ocellatus TaxID=259542 RepID=A0AAV4DLG4_9GAST|nr:hypothetical protein PoB_007132100 [Plakobranchus ocellatus]
MTVKSKVSSKNRISDHEKHTHTRKDYLILRKRIHNCSIERFTLSMQALDNKFNIAGTAESNGDVVFEIWFVFLFTASPQQGDLRLSGPPSGKGAGGWARTRDRRISADIRADSLATVPPTPSSF